MKSIRWTSDRGYTFRREMTLAAGTKLGQYEILARLGQGGMGEVYRARDTKLDRDVALKILPEVFAGDADRRARFDREAKTLASLSVRPSRALIYVQSRDNPTERVQISVNGGESPVWSQMGDRLFYRQGTAMMDASVSTGGTLAAGTPVEVFNRGWSLAGFGYDAARSGDRFLMIEQPPEAIRNRIDVVLNWFTRLEERMTK